MGLYKPLQREYKTGSIYRQQYAKAKPVYRNKEFHFPVNCRHTTYKFAMNFTNMYKHDRHSYLSHMFLFTLMIA